MKCNLLCYRIYFGGMVMKNTEGPLFDIFHPILETGQPKLFCKIVDSRGETAVP
jgi:hypothetical protein